MSAGNFSKFHIFTAKNLLKSLVWLILCCVCVNFAEFHNVQVFAAPDLVYCPLQKQWVARYEPKTEKKYQPFDEICATDKRKHSLQTELALKIAHPLTEKIVFDYLAKGNNFPAELNRLPDAPQNELSAQTKLKTALKNGSYDFTKAVAANLTLPQTPRPPTFNARSFFEPKVSRALNQISRNINPRSPPIYS